MKRIITLLLTLVMVLSLTMPAQAAGKTKASTMRLMETEGTATVENAIGRKMSIKDKMQLYSGYKVATKAASYAYISLDNSKTVKLDASSAVKVNQSGKKLELDVTAGKLMFNVPVSLKSDESLNIRTSTMVTGIRGTAGWVDAMNRYTTRIGVLEGAVTVQSVDPDTGVGRSVTITGGQIATIIHHERANDIAQQLIDDGVIVEENIIAELTKTGQIVEGIQESDVPGFVAGEVASDSDLQQRMEEESPLNVDEIMEGAEDRKKQDEKAAEEKELEIQAALEELKAEDLGLPFGGEAQVIVETETVTVIERVEIFTPVATPGGLNDPETADVQSALDSVGVAAITNPGSDFDITALTMDASDVLYVIGGTLNITAPWTVNGTVSLVKTTLTNNSTITVSGTLEIGQGSTLTNNGEIDVNSTNSLHISGTVNNTGTIWVGKDAAGKMKVEAGGVLNNDYEDSSAGEIIIDSNSSMENIGKIFNYSIFENYAEFVNTGDFYNLYSVPYDGREMYLDDPPMCFGLVVNDGTITNNGILENHAEFYNYGTIQAGANSDYSMECYAIAQYDNDGYGALHMLAGSTITNNGKDAHALVHHGGYLDLKGGSIVHRGSNKGYALYCEKSESLTYGSGAAGMALMADSADNLIGAPDMLDVCIGECQYCLDRLGSEFDDVLSVLDEDGYPRMCYPVIYDSSESGTVYVVYLTPIGDHSPA